MSIAARTPRVVVAGDDTPPSEHEQHPEQRPLDLAQALRLFTGLALMGWSILWWSNTGSSPLGPVMTLVALVGGLVVVGLSVGTRSAGWWRRFDLRVLVFTLIVTGLWLSSRSGEHIYQTDEITTGQASALVLLSGHNPYATDLTPQLNKFQLPPEVSTPLLNGGTIHSTSYPALSFLLYVPFGALLGLGSPFALVADGVAWILLMLLLWRLLDERLRPVVPLLASFPFYLSFIDGGVSDVLYLPFLLLALHRWDRFLDRRIARHARWLGPVCLGLACSVKPTPWLIAPFLVAALAMESARRGRNPWRTAAGYCAVAAAAFLAVNGPFIAMDAGAWAHGTLLPLTSPIVPFGQGIAMLPVYLHIAGGHVSYLGIAGIAAILASFGAFIAFYPRTARLLPLMAAAPLLLSSRSLYNYFIFVAMLMLVHAANVPYARRSPFPGQRLFAWSGRTLAAAGAAATVAALVAFVLSPAPLQLTITAQQGSGAPGTPVPTITVSAVNRTDKPVKPFFLVTSAGWMNPAWSPRQGPAVLAPHAQATYVLVSTDSRTRLDAGAVYLVDALATDPGSVSTSEWATAH